MGFIENRKNNANRNDSIYRWTVGRLSGNGLDRNCQARVSAVCTEKEKRKQTVWKATKGHHFLPSQAEIKKKTATMEK